MVNTHYLSRKKSTIVQHVGGNLEIALVIVQNLLLLPLYLQFVSASEYGYWVTISSIVILLSALNFRIPGLMSQRIASAYAKLNYKRVADYAVHAIGIYIPISILFGFACWIVGFWLEGILRIEIDHNFNSQLIFLIAAVAACIGFFNSVFRGILQALLRPLYPIYFSIFSKIVGFLTVLFLLYSDVGISSIPISLAVSEIVNCMLLLIYLSRLRRGFCVELKFKADVVKDYVAHMPNLFSGTVGSNLITSFPPIAITAFLGPETTTTFSIVSRISIMISQVINTANAALLGPFSHLVGSADMDRIRETVKHVLLASFAGGVVMFGIYSVANLSFVRLWLGEDFLVEQYIVVALGSGAFAVATSSVLRNLLFGFGEVKFVSSVALIEGSLFALVLVLSIEDLGLMAPPVAAILAGTISIGILLLKLRNIVNYNVDKNVIIRLIAGVVFSAFILVYFSDYDSNISWTQFLKESILLTVLLSSVMYAAARPAVRKK